MFKIKTYLTFYLTIISTFSFGQKIENWIAPTLDSTTVNVVNLEINTIQNSNYLQPFLEKLYRIKLGSSIEKAIIVHLGDSHIQADMMTAVIRSQFQNYFGDAGRGLIFPYQVAKSNAPSDVFSNSKNSWKSSRITKQDTLIPRGISGFGIQSQDKNPEFNIGLRFINEDRSCFDKVNLFYGNNTSEILIDYNENQRENVCLNESNDYTSINLKSLTSTFKITFPASDTINFYGVSVEKNNEKGLIYHSIGANGAKYSDYNKTSNFWKQLPKLKADCYVISLGTNEAQDQNLTPDIFLADVKKTVDLIKIATPNASIILVSPPISYYKKIKPNPILETMTQAIKDFCFQNNLCFWDLFNVSKGLEGASNWKSLQLLRPDLVHFSKDGYVLQGNLFLTAFSELWNKFLPTK